MATNRRKRGGQLQVGFAIKKGKAGQSTIDTEALENAGEIIVKSGTRFLTRPEGAGYESRLWEKATCNVLGELKPEDLVSNPAAFGIQVTSVKARTIAKRKQNR